MVLNRQLDLDDSLTQLDWLINFNVVTDKSTNTTKLPCTEVDRDNFMQKLPVDVDYKTRCEKPAHSYAKLITMAIMDSEEKMLVLSDIYKWITDNYLYYKNTSSNWHNSVRHNLSMNKNFKKVARRQSDRRKGRYWTIIAGVKDFFRDKSRFVENEKRKSDALNMENISFVNKKRIKEEKENTISCDGEDILSTAVTMSNLYSFGEKECKSEEMRETKNILSETQKRIEVVNCDSSLEERNCSQHPCSDLKNSYDWRTAEKENFIMHASKKNNEISDDGDSLETREPLWTKALLNTDLLLSDYDPKFESFLDQTANLPLDLTTIEKDITEELAWIQCRNDNQNGTSLGTESGMSTPTGQSDDEQASVWNDELMAGDDDMISYFEKDMTDIFETIPVSPTKYSNSFYSHIYCA